jgi:CheY-like chemotaxis protein
MPEMNGHEVLEAMKSDVRLREIPVVMISGIDDLGKRGALHRARRRRLSAQAV